MPAVSGKSSAILSDEEVARYHRDGLLIPRYRLPPDAVKHLQKLIDELIARNPDVPQELLLDANVEDGSLGPVTGSREFLKYAAYPPLLDVLEQIIGPDILLWDVAVICKPPATGKPIAWHQDSPYMVKIKPIVTATIWLAVDGANPGNGGMRFMPGAHKRGMLEHVRLTGDVLTGFETSVKPGLLDEREARDVILEPGQFCVFHAHTPHSSPPNRSGRRRAGLILRYIPGTTFYDDTVAAVLDQQGNPVEPQGRPIYLLRGEDRTGRNVLTELPSFAA